MLNQADKELQERNNRKPSVSWTKEAKTNGESRITQAGPDQQPLNTEPPYTIWL